MHHTYLIILVSPWCKGTSNQGTDFGWRKRKGDIFKWLSRRSPFNHKVCINELLKNLCILSKILMGCFISYEILTFNYFFIFAFCQFHFSPDDVEGFAQGMLGHRLVTKQTSDEGVLVKKVVIYPAFMKML